MFPTIASVGATALVHGGPASQRRKPVRSKPSSRAVARAADPISSVCARTIDLIDRSEQAKAPALTQYVTTVWSRLLAWKMRRATRTILSSLDDRILSDIGVQRSEIDRVLSDMQRRTLHWHV